MIRNKTSKTNEVIIRLLVGILMSIFLTLANTEEKKNQAIETQIVEPKSVMEYKLSEGEEIVDIIFGEAEMTVTQAMALGMKGLEQKKATNTVKMQYPKVVVTEKAIKFFDEKGKFEKEIKLKHERQTIEFCPETGNMVIKGGLCREEGSYQFVKVINNKEKFIKKISEKFYEKKVSGNGNYVVMLCGVGVCKLYNINTGKELWEKKESDGISFTDITDGIIDILYDGKVVVVQKSTGTKGIVSLIDINGKELWNKEIEMGVYEVFTTKDGKIIIHVIYIHEGNEKYKLYGFDKNGKFLWEEPTKKYKELQNGLDNLVIPQNTNILYGIGNGYLWAMDINTSNILWRQPFIKFPEVKIVYEPEPEPMGIYQVSFQGKYVLIDGAFLLDGKTGKVLKQFKEAGGKFSGKDHFWRKKDNKIEIFNISDILKQGN